MLSSGLTHKSPSKNLPGNPIYPAVFQSSTLIHRRRYFDVETRLVPVKDTKGFVMDPHDAMPFIDENTIGIIVILGSTYTGHYEDVALMSSLRMPS